jgi:hypothetical protein
LFWIHEVAPASLRALAVSIDEGVAKGATGNRLIAFAMEGDNAIVRGDMRLTKKRKRGRSRQSVNPL